MSSTSTLIRSTHSTPTPTTRRCSSSSPKGTLRRAHIPHLARWQASTVLHPDASDFGILVELLHLQEALDTKAAALRSATVSPYVLGTILAGLADVVNAQQGVVDSTKQRYEALVWRFEDLLDRHHADSRSPAWYASKLQTTRRTLARACRQSRDASPKRLIDSRVVLEAKRRLATTSDTVEAVGYDLGFSEPTNFVKFFKRVVGTTPEAFRRSLGGGGIGKRVAAGRQGAQASLDASESRGRVRF